MKLYGIFCAGGFGREVLPLAKLMLISQRIDDAELVFIDDHIATPILNDYPVLSVEAFFAHPAAEKYVAIAHSDGRVRAKLVARMQALGALPFSIYANEHVNLTHNRIGEGAIFCDYTTITANAVIGNYFHANIYSYVAHDCMIGDYVTFAPRVHCNGNVIIEDFAYIGTSAIIKQGTPDKPLIIGKGAIIGMGAVVTKSVAAGETVIGNPARPLVRAGKDHQATQANS